MRTTPRAFFVASELVKNGADQQAIVRNLFKTRSFSHLKLWGRALARIKTHAALGAVSASIKHADFEQSGSSPGEVRQVFQELVALLSDTKVVVFLVEVEPGVLTEAYLSARQPFGLPSLLRQAGGIAINDSQGKLVIRGKDAEQAEQYILEKLQAWLKSADDV